MDFKGFTEEDFNVFLIDGLEHRMEALISNIRPKLDILGHHFSPTLATLTGDEMFSHVAKHARRTVNPPKDTWVAIANNKRGYKMVPHFQIGLWHTHLFVWFAVIYEAPIKAEYGELLKKHYPKIIKKIPKDFVWSIDHTAPNAISHGKLKNEDFESMFERLKTVKKAELLCGINISKEEAVSMSGVDLVTRIDATFRNLIPLYQLSQKSSTIIKY